MRSLQTHLASLFEFIQISCSRQWLHSIRHSLRLKIRQIPAEIGLLQTHRHFRTQSTSRISLISPFLYVIIILQTTVFGQYLPPIGAPVGGLPLATLGAQTPIANPAVWSGIPAQYAYNTGGQGLGVQRTGTGGAIAGQNYDANGFRDQNGYYLGGAGLRNGWDVGKTYGGGQDYGVTGVQGNAFGDVNGRNKGHQVAGFSTSYQKNESGNKATYYDDGLGHGGAVQYGMKDQRYKDGAGNAFGGGVHDSSLKTNAAGNQGQFGAGGGFRNSDNQGGTLNGGDLYRSGLVQGGGASGGLIGPISAPVLLPQPVPVAQRPIPIIAAPSNTYAPSAPVYQLRPPSSPYLVPTPNKLYVDRPVYR